MFIVYLFFSVLSFLPPNFQHLFAVLVGSLCCTLCIIHVCCFTCICTVVGSSVLHGQIKVINSPVFLAIEYFGTRLEFLESLAADTQFYLIVYRYYYC
jgi:hypothetical protein